MAVVDSSGTFRVGEWVVEPALGLVRRGEEAVHVTPRAMAVLLHLARAEGAVVARNEILDAIWPRMDVTQDALSQCIVELRKAFHDDSKSPEVIETIPRRGVRLIAPVAAAQATNGIAEEAAHEEKEIGGARKQKLGPTSRVFAPRRLAAMVLVIGGAALGAFWLAEHRAPEAIGTNEELARLSEFPGTSARARILFTRQRALQTQQLSP